MARQIGTLQEWLNLDQAAEYLGVRKRSLINAVNLCKDKICNDTLEIKRFGNRTLISKSCIDATPNIITQYTGGIV